MIAGRIAILRFENLGPLSSDWMGRAFSEIIAAELPGTMVIPSAHIHSLDRTVGPRPVAAPGISTERTEAILAGANRIGYGDFSVRDGRISARLTIEDPQAGRMLSSFGATATDVVAAATSLARQLYPQAAPYLTQSAEAAKDYVGAMEAADPHQMAEDAAAAVAADPNFGPGYRLLADAKIQQRDRDGALAALDQALARGNAISGQERALIQLQAASLRNDFAGRERALAEIAKFNPGDVDSWRTLADAAYARHDYSQAVEAYRKALQIHPDDPALLNSYSYTQANAGDFDGAMRTLRHYLQLRPKDANPLDSMGDVNLMYGHLAEAEDLYLKADQADRKLLQGGDLLKAALTRLLTGDVPAASRLDQQFIEARAALGDAQAPIHRAEWQWITGNATAAKAQLAAITDAALASRADVDLAIYSLLEGDRAAAAQWGLKASSTGAPQSRGVEVAVARFISQPSASAAEWVSRAEQMFRNVQQPELQNLTLAYALLLDRHFAEAIDALKRVYDGPSSEPGIPILIGWSLMQTGHAQEAGQWLRFNPVPAYSGIGPFTPVYFSKLLALRKKTTSQ